MPYFLCYFDQFKDVFQNQFCSDIVPSAGTGPQPFANGHPSLIWRWKISVKYCINKDLAYRSPQGKYPADDVMTVIK